MTNEQYAASLRKIADFFENHPEIPLPHDAHRFCYFSMNTKEEAAVMARALGQCDKRINEQCNFFELSRSFGEIEFTAIFNRSSICERVQTGTRHVEATTVPERHIEAHEEPIYEWKCPESLLE